MLFVHHVVLKTWSTPGSPAGVGSDLRPLRLRWKNTTYAVPDPAGMSASKKHTTLPQANPAFGAVNRPT